MSYLISNLLVLGIFLAYYFAMPRLKNHQNRMFLALLVLQSLILLFGLFFAGGASYPAAWRSLLYTAYIACFLGRPYCCFLFTADVLHLKKEDAPRLVRLARWVWIAKEALALSSPFTGAVFRVDGQGVSPGPLSFIVHLSFLYTVLSILLMARYSRRLTVADRFGMWGCQTVLLIGNLFYFALPSDELASTICLMATIILYLSFENPNLLLANRGNAFNMRAFREMMEETIGKKPYRILSFALRDYIDMRAIYGGGQLDQGVALISQFLVKTYPECQVFYLRSGRFVILGSENMDWDQMRQNLNARFQAPWIADDAELDLSIAFVQVDERAGLDHVDRILNYLFLAFENARETLAQRDGLIDDANMREIGRQVDVKRSLERCLEQNEVEIFLQPLIDGKLRKLAGAEVLSRIRDENGKLISPGLFVPIAEKSGRINLMGEQILEKACQFVRDHNLEEIGLSWINVNLSPIQCMKTDLSDRFATIMEQYGVSTEVIHLEITEQSVLDISRLEEQIQTLRGAGFYFSLDDYGSGYSNLSRVKQYPFVNIKLDMGIVWDYFRDQDQLLPTTVQTFKQMGFSVTAEGIESEEMADAMCAIGCDYLQGYYFSEPLPAEEFVRKYTLIKQSA